MSNLLYVVAPYTALAASALIATAWQGTLLVLLTLLGMRLFPAISAAARSIVWLAALLLLVLLNLAPVLYRPAASAVAHAPRLLHIDPRWSVVLAGLWAALSVLRCIQLLRSAHALHALTRRATPLPIGPSLAALLQTRRAQLCTSADVDRPSVVGFFSPKVLLPQDLAASLSASQLEPIVRHEMEHLRRCDDWTNLLQKLALALFPLSPALLWVEHRLCDERELACDDGVLRATAARKAYATSLATLAEHSLLRRSLTLALGAWDKPTALERRIRRILYRPDSRMTPGMTATAVALLIVGAAAGSCMVARAPQIVSFTTAPHQSPTILASAPTLTGITTPHIALVKATLPQRTTTHRRSARPVLRTITATRPRPEMTVPRITLTRWQPPAAATPSQPSVGAVEIDFAYAAVRVPDGWLIIQL
ncbi:hypothetical protein GOB94_01575 [Granulicella sp. 5B5]|uniref:M56 family metallopeptidase n=1 Tax=Granulicella sp. 5B5 TaxID=1617967 RepID=UPI0015F4A99E|nr:M56 family metallopeptidase [Granulicella sp. 5B5]QMV17537.1 hypothetical protein GOB94_01575 [Granulicella sp. 5B5]